MRVYERFGGVVGLAFFGCYGFAISLLVISHTLLTTADDAKVVDVNGNVVDVAPYTESELAGRQVYMEQVCWHCHSQFVRPVNQEDRRFGPVSQPGESAHDVPHTFGTRRIGPDLAREGGLRSDDWQLAHLWNPRSTVGGSVMPAFTWLFQDNINAKGVAEILAEHDYDNDGTLSSLDDIVQPRPAALAERIKGLDSRGLVGSRYRQDPTGNDLKPGADGKVPYVDVFTQVADEAGRPTELGDGQLTDRDGGLLPTKEAFDLLAYIQRLGTSIGPWRAPLGATTPQRPAGEKYNPRMLGVSATWKDSRGTEQTSEVPDGRMPRRAREARVHGAAAQSKERVAQAKDLELEYEALMGAWRRKNPDWARRLDEGKTLFLENCAPCHGDTGRGNGLAAQFLYPRPRDFTQSAFRYRSTQAGNLPLHGDLYRTIWRGMPGASMPPFRQLGDDNIWLLVDYVESLLETIGGDAKRFDDRAAAFAVPTVPRVSSEDLKGLLRRGKAVYSAAKCSNCHGTTGRGDGPSWNTNMDSGAVMRPRDLAPRFPGDQPALRIRGGVFPEDLYRTLFTGLGGTGMASSRDDFNAAWTEARKLDALKAAGAPQAQVDAQAKLARKALIVPLWDEDLLTNHGVIREAGVGGQTVEYLDRLRETRDGMIGDDWALIFYVMDLLGARDLIQVTDE